MNKFIGAVIGCGRMGAFTRDSVRQFAPDCWFPLSHAEAMKAHAEITLTALADVDATALQNAQAAHHVDRGFADYRQLIRDVRPDIVGIATRTPERPEIIEFALDHGVRALHLEKPLCNTVAKLDELARRFADPSIFCTYGTLRRYFPVYSAARELARSGKFGTLQQVRVDFGIGRLFWTHPHAVDILLFMAGDAPVKSVAASLVMDDVVRSGASLDGDPVVTSAVLELENGVTGVISQAGGSDVTLACSEGTITVEADGRRIRCRFGKDGDPYWNASDVVDSCATEPGGTWQPVDRLVRGLRANEPGLAGDKDAIINGQRVLFACVQSELLGGRRVDPRDLDRDIAVSGRVGDRYA